MEVFAARLNAKGITSPWIHRAVAVAAFLFPILSLAVVSLHLLGPGSGRSFFVTVLMSLVFVLTPASRRWPRSRLLLLCDVGLVSAIIAVGLYIGLNWDAIVDRSGVWSPLDLAVASAGTLVLLEATRRVSGLPFLLLCLVFIVYALFGQYFPRMFIHTGMPWRELAARLYLSTQGFLGMGVAVVMDYIFPFIVVGGLFRAVGGMALIGRAAQRLVQGKPGGEAKIAVLTSAAFGMFSGSGVANVVTTGAFTIPLMKKTGYPARFAAAVEACSSTGGQIMPPVLGAAAFLMVEYTGIPYLQLALATAIPALIYYLSMYIRVDLEGRRLGLRGQPVPTQPLGQLLIELVPFFLTFLALIAGIVWYTAVRAVLLATAVLILCGLFWPKLRLTWMAFKNAMMEATWGIVVTGTACVAIGILIVATGVTGLGIRLSGLAVDVTGGNLFLALLMTALLAIVLGMGLPPSVVYIFIASTLAPALIELGASVLAAHLYTFYFGVLGLITPPVALASFAAAAIADESPFAVGWESILLGKAAFILPFLFIYQPGVILQGPGLLVAEQILVATVGVVALTVGVSGYLRRPLDRAEQMVWFLTGIIFIIPGWVYDAVGAVLIAGLLGYHFYVSPAARLARATATSPRPLSTAR